MFPILMSCLNGCPQMLPRCIAWYCTIRRQDEPLWRLRQRVIHGLLDRFQVTCSEYTLAFQAAHERSSKHLRYVFWGESPLSQLQATVDYMTRVSQERGQVIIPTFIVTDVQN